MVALLERRPDVAVITTAYRHSGLLYEAIESVKDQIYNGSIFHVVVNDGCPFPETHSYCSVLARTRSNFFYVYSENRGLSGARNLGIGLVLEMLPTVEAIFFLDADNRLLKYSIAKFVEVLWEQGASWAYPDLVGLKPDQFRRSPPYFSRLLLLFQNYCDSGSLVRIEVFKAALRFDEDFRDGLEDWDFFLRAMLQGYTGAHVSDSGFIYRQRAASMVSHTAGPANRSRQQIASRFSRERLPRSIAAIEHTEHPRFAFICADSTRTYLFSDVNASPTELDLDSLLTMWEAHSVKPFASPFPAYLAVGSAAAYHRLRKCKASNSLFWLAALEQSQGSPTDITVTDLFKEYEVLLIAKSDIVRSLNLKGTCPSPACATLVDRFIERLCPAGATPLLTAPLSGNPHSVLSSLLADQIPFPSGGARSPTLGLIVSEGHSDRANLVLSSLGDAEKGDFRSTHLFVVGPNSVLSDANHIHFAAFDSIAALPPAENVEKRLRWRSCLYWLDVLIYTQDCLESLAEIQSLGVRNWAICFDTINLQAVGFDRWTRQVLDLEHTIERFLVSSQEEKYLLASRGVPEGKISIFAKSLMGLAVTPQAL